MKCLLIVVVCGIGMIVLMLVVYVVDLFVCKNVCFVDVGWFDIVVIMGFVLMMLQGFGYNLMKMIVLVLIMFVGIKSKQIDVFFGYWLLMMDLIIQLFMKVGMIKVFVMFNLIGVKYMFVVFDYVYQGGLKLFVDIQKYVDKFNGKIYGIELGNDGNVLIKKMIDGNQFGFGKFKLVELSEVGMLVEVNCVICDKQWIVFFGWELYLMNVQMKIDYLIGGDDVFGLNYGEVKVLMVMLFDYLQCCLNVVKFVLNFQFMMLIENYVMVLIMNKQDLNKVVVEWLKVNL